MSDSMNPALAIAGRVLKGAIVDVLRIPTGCTTVSFSQNNKTTGCLTVRVLNQDKEPSADIYQAIEAAANNKIKEDAPVLFFSDSRLNLEAKYKDAFYDASTPRKDSQFACSYIPNWNLSIVPDEANAYITRTGPVGEIKVTKTKYTKQKLDVYFSISPTDLVSSSILTTKPSESTYAGPDPSEVAKINVPIQRVISKEAQEEEQRKAKLNEERRMRSMRATLDSLVVLMDKAAVVLARGPGENAVPESMRKDIELSLAAIHEKISLDESGKIATQKEGVSDVELSALRAGLESSLKLEKATTLSKKAQEHLDTQLKNLNTPLIDSPAIDAPVKEDVKEEAKDAEQVITPWEVEAADGIDYDKLLIQFGCLRIKEDQIARIERLTNMRAHRFLRRGLFFSHRDLDFILDEFEAGRRFYLYTGRGPSSEALHLGHLIPFQFTQYLQQAFGAPLVIQLTDDEKFLWKDLELEECYRLGFQNAKDIIACGFDPENTFIFSDMDYIHRMYPNVLKIQKCVTYSQGRGIFGFTPESNIGKSAFPAVQAAPSFSSSFPVVLKKLSKTEPGKVSNVPCLIPQAIDQDPYFRMTRETAPKLGLYKPALIHSKFFPALQGHKTKMSASAASTTIMVTDSPADIKNKVNKYAFSGGQKTLEEQRRLGANLEVDVAYNYLRFFLEDDQELQEIGEKYARGELLTGQVKARLIEVLVEMVQEQQKRRDLVTDDVVRHFMTERELKC